MMKEIFVQVKGFGFVFHYDGKSRHNLMSPAFLSFFKEDYSSIASLEDNQRETTEIYSHSKDAFPMLPDHLHHFSFVGVYQECDNKVIRCSDNIFRKCKGIRFSFQINNKPFTKVFYLDGSLCHNKNVNVIINSAAYKQIEELIPSARLADFGFS